MGKMMSILEKYKLVEKETNATNEIPYTDGESVETLALEEENSVTENLTEVEDHESVQSQFGEVVFSEESHLMIDYGKEENALYDKEVSLEEIYKHYQLGGQPVTETVYLLENLISALPQELPEYVKKTTVNNIITASAIDMNKLLEDGSTRSKQLTRFLEEYRSNNLNQISTLKKEIEELSIVINKYQQEIKEKEILIQNETKLVETEFNRLSEILSFFKSSSSL